MNEDTMTPPITLLLSKKEALILQLLTSTGEMYGLDMVKASRGALKRGLIYSTLSCLIAIDCVEWRREEQPDSVSGVTRLLYKHTPQGARAYATHSHTNPARDSRPIDGVSWWRLAQVVAAGVLMAPRVRTGALDPDSTTHEGS